MRWSSECWLCECRPPQWDDHGWHHSLSVSNQLHMSAGCICSLLPLVSSQPIRIQGNTSHMSWSWKEGRVEESNRVFMKEWRERMKRTVELFSQALKTPEPDLKYTNRTKVIITHKTTVHYQDVLSSADA